MPSRAFFVGDCERAVQEKRTSRLIGIDKDQISDLEAGAPKVDLVDAVGQAKELAIELCRLEPGAPPLLLLPDKAARWNCVPRSHLCSSEPGKSEPLHLRGDVLAVAFAA